jgi:hypothetical protein
MTSTGRTVAITAGSFAALIVLADATLLGEVNSAQSEGTQKETALTAQYLQNQLSTVLTIVKEQLGVADRESAKLDQILTDAIKGRTSGASAAKVDQSQLVLSAIKEAYPNLSGLDTYDKMMQSISLGQQAYADDQAKLLDMLRAFDSLTCTTTLEASSHGPTIRSQPGRRASHPDKLLAQHSRKRRQDDAGREPERGQQQPEPRRPDRARDRRGPVGKMQSGPPRRGPGWPRRSRVPDRHGEHPFRSPRDRHIRLAPQPGPGRLPDTSSLSNRQAATATTLVTGSPS